MQNLYVGQRVKANAEFRKDGVLTDPLLIRCLLRHPSGTTEIFNFPSTVLTRRSVGFYRAMFLVDESGFYHLRWEGSGTVDAVDEVQFEVYASSVIE